MFARSNFRVECQQIHIKWNVCKYECMSVPHRVLPMVMSIIVLGLGVAERPRPRLTVYCKTNTKINGLGLR